MYFHYRCYLNPEICNISRCTDLLFLSGKTGYNDWDSNSQPNCELWLRTLWGILHQLSIVQWLGFGNAQCYQTFIELHEVGSIPYCVSKIDLTPCPWKLGFTHWHRWHLYFRNGATWGIKTQLRSLSESNTDQKQEGRDRGKNMAEKWKEWDRNNQKKRRIKYTTGIKVGQWGLKIQDK
jgi:hypothetical protein